MGRRRRRVKSRTMVLGVQKDMGMGTIFGGLIDFAFVYNIQPACRAV